MNASVLWLLRRPQLTAPRLVRALRVLLRALPSALVGSLLLQALPVHAQQVIDVDTPALVQLHEEGVAVIDIRRPEEWRDTGVIEGSHLMTFFDRDGRYDAADWFETFRLKLDPEQPVVLICRTGVRSEKVTAWLSKRMNLPEVYNAREGIVGWKSGGGNIVHSP